MFQEEKEMAKKVIGNIKLQIPAGKATPAPPVGPALGQHGVNIAEFCPLLIVRFVGTTTALLMSLLDNATCSSPVLLTRVTVPEQEPPFSLITGSSIDTLRAGGAMSPCRTTSSIFQPQ